MLVGKTFAVVSTKTAEELQNMYLRNAYRGIFPDDFAQGDIKQLRIQNSSLYENTVVNAAKTANEALRTILNRRPFWSELLPLSTETYDLAYQLQLKYQFPGFADALQLASAISEKAP